MNWVQFTKLKLVIIEHIVFIKDIYLYWKIFCDSHICWVSKINSLDVYTPVYSLNIGLNLLPSESFMQCLHFLLGYFVREFQILQLIVLAAFVVVD